MQKELMEKFVEVYGEGGEIREYLLREELI